MHRTENSQNPAARQMPGIAGWLLSRLTGGAPRKPALALLERISLAPRQSLALIEAEGMKFLVATSGDGAPAFYPLDGTRRAAHQASIQGRQRQGGRISW